MTVDTQHAVERHACEILARVFPGTTWSVSPRVRARLESTSALWQLDCLASVPNDVNALGYGQVASAAPCAPHEDRVDSLREQAA